MRRRRRGGHLRYTLKEAIITQNLSRTVTPIFTLKEKKVRWLRASINSSEKPIILITWLHIQLAQSCFQLHGQALRGNQYTLRHFSTRHA